MGKRLLGSLAAIAIAVAIAVADVDVAALLLFLLHIVLLPVCWQRHYNAILCTHTGTHTHTDTHLWQLIFYTFFNSLSIILVCFFFVLLFQNDTMRLLYMYHAQDPPHGSVRPGTLPDPARAFRPYRPMVLMQRAQLQLPSPHDERVRVLELRNEDVELPGGDTPLFWCKMFKLEDINRKHHLIRVSTVCTRPPTPAAKCYYLNKMHN